MLETVDTIDYSEIIVIIIIVIIISTIFFLSVVFALLNLSHARKHIIYSYTCTQHIIYTHARTLHVHTSRLSAFAFGAYTHPARSLFHTFHSRSLSAQKITTKITESISARRSILPFGEACFRNLY